MRRIPWRSRPLRGESGLTLIEMLVSLSILAVVFSGFAAVLVGGIRGVVVTEHETRATAIATEAVEQLQASDWDSAALYEDEVAVADSRWSQRLDEDHDGLEVVELPGPPADSADRVAQVPAPSSLVIDPGNIAFTVDRYVFWVDRDGDGDAETKRFVVHVSWESRGRPREVSLASERIPTVTESPATATGARVLQLWVSSDPASLDDVTGVNEQDLSFVVRLNRNVTAGELAYYAFEDGDWVLREQAMDGVLRQDEGPPGYTRWTTTVDAGSEVFANGTTTARFTALDEALNVVQAFVTITYRSGPVPDDGEPDPGVPPQPPSTVGSGTTSPLPALDDPSEEDGEDDGEGANGDGGNGESYNGVAANVRILNVADTGSICVNSGGHYRGDLVLTIRVEGLTEVDGSVMLDYDRITNWGQRQTGTVTDPASFSSQSGHVAAYSFTVSSGRRFEPGTEVVFDIKAADSSGNNDGIAGVGPYQVGSC